MALVGSGPASLIAAYDLIRHGYRVTIFEALHGLGGVLAYGIPNFRLPREIIRTKIESPAQHGRGVSHRLHRGQDGSGGRIVRGRISGHVSRHRRRPAASDEHSRREPDWRLHRQRIPDATESDGGIPFPESDTPIRIGKRVVVVGGGNSAMDAARWSRRMGSDTTIMFRRGRAELRARLEEIEHAEEEGVHFDFLAAPVRLFGDEKGILREMECIRMQLGEVDESGPALTGAHAGFGIPHGGGHGGDGDRSKPQPDRTARHAAACDQARQGGD